MDIQQPQAPSIMWSLKDILNFILALNQEPRDYQIRLSHSVCFIDSTFFFRSASFMFFSISFFCLFHSSCLFRLLSYVINSVSLISSICQFHLLGVFNSFRLFNSFCSFRSFHFIHYVNVLFHSLSSLSILSIFTYSVYFLTSAKSLLLFVLYNASTHS